MTGSFDARVTRIMVGIGVYSIALNEAQHVARWAASCSDADFQFVLDTGSDDGTPALLLAHGVNVQEASIIPWRFDDARNQALNLLPSDLDICVSLDLDCVMLPGWKSIIKKAWVGGINRLYHKISENVEAANSFKATSRCSRIHSRLDFRWHRAVHEEVRHVTDGEKRAWINEDIMVHIPDRTRERHYLPLLDLQSKTTPDDATIAFEHGRALMAAGHISRSIEALRRYLALVTATWAEERSQAMIYLAKMMKDERETWLLRAVAEAPQRREAALSLAEFYYQQANWSGLLWISSQGLQRSKRTFSHLDIGFAWGSRLEELAAIASWQLGLKAVALDHARSAIASEPNNRRLLANMSRVLAQE